MKTEIITVGGVHVEVVYKRVSRLRVTVYASDGRVQVSSPEYCRRAEIENFIVSKLGWIKSHRERYLRRAQTVGAGQNECPLWGKTLPLEIVDHGQSRSRAALSGGIVKLYGHNLTPAEKTALLDRLYRRELAEAVPRLIEKWEPVIGVKVRGVFYRKMKTHWGSCNYTAGTIRLNSELAKRNPPALEYVLVHEMVHIIEPAHNKNFYRILERIFPDWKDMRKKLNRGDL